MNATTENPFRARLFARLAGQYRAPEVSDSNQRAFHAEEPGVSFERERRRIIELQAKGVQPCNPF